jgi:hypothetical protein
LLALCSLAWARCSTRAAAKSCVEGLMTPPIFHDRALIVSD